MDWLVPFVLGIVFFPVFLFGIFIGLTLLLYMWAVIAGHRDRSVRKKQALPVKP